jgi:hypothetical protein
LKRERGKREKRRVRKGKKVRKSKQDFFKDIGSREIDGRRQEEEREKAERR